MKRLISVLLVFVLLVGLCVPASAQTTAGATVTAPMTVALGDTVTCTVAVNEPGPVLAAMVEPVFDRTAFELVSGEFLQEGSMQDFSGGDGVILFEDLTNITGQLMQFTLKVRSGVKPGTVYTIGCNYSVRDFEDELQTRPTQSCTVKVYCRHSYDQEICVWCGRNEYVAEVDGLRYKTVQEAVNRVGDGCVTLLEDSEESVYSLGSLTMDLNGHSLGALVVSGVLYGMDSSTNDYDCTDGYGTIGSFTGTYMQLSSGGHRRYVAIEEEGVLSFHRVYVGVTHMSLTTEKMDFGYKFGFYGDQMVQKYVESFSIQVWTDPERVFSYTFDQEDFVPGTAGNVKTLRIKNIVSTLDSHEENAAAILTDVTSQCNLILCMNGKDVEIASGQVTGNLKTMLTVVDANVSAYTPAQIEFLQLMLYTYEEPLKMAGCKLDNIRSWS